LTSISASYPLFNQESKNLIKERRKRRRQKRRKKEEKERKEKKKKEKKEKEIKCIKMSFYFHFHGSKLNVNVFLSFSHYIPFLFIQNSAKGKDTSFDHQSLCQCTELSLICFKTANEGSDQKKGKESRERSSKTMKN
jgi:hypothetical protein